MNRCLYLSTLLVLLSSIPVQAQLRDGQLFDQGASMTELSERASEESSRVAYLRGQWDVQYTQFGDDEEAHATSATASTTLINRGHGFLERFHCADFDGQGHDRSTVIFLTHVPSTGDWNLGLADSWNECIRLYSGGFEGDRLVLQTIFRGGGSGKLRQFRISLIPEGDDAFELVAEGGIYGDELKKDWSRRYTRREESSDFMAGAGYGQAASDRPAEASQFDFLIGEWDERHHMTFPNGQEAKWAANGTAVHMLDGHAIMEHGWFDTDPQVPDAATTILRIYNRSVRRWECMYTTNRFNSILYFGGVKEGDEIVLHAFDRHLNSGPFSYWTFHSMQPDSYGWYGNTSNDRGETFKKTWIIEGTRKKES